MSLIIWPGHGMKWKMERNGNFGMEDARMEWKSVFHTNSILGFVHGIFRKIYTDSDN